MSNHVKLVRVDSGYWELHDERGNWCLASGSTAYEVVQAYMAEQKMMDSSLDINIMMPPDMVKPMLGVKALLNIPALIIKSVDEAEELS